MMHKTGPWMTALAVAGLLLAACGGAEPAASGASEGGAGSEAAAGGGGGTELSFAHSYTTDHPHHRCGVQAIADKVNEQDVGVTVEVFPNSQLGADADRFTSVMSGDIDLDLQGSSALSATYEPIGILDSAYVVDGADHLFEFFESAESEQLQADFLEQTGARILGPFFFGMRHFTANQPIRTPEDLQGLRMRFPDSPTYLRNAEAMGAQATAVAFEEVFLSLQQGVIDGQENPIPTIASLNLPEVQSHVSLTGHQTGSQLIIISETVWQELTPEQREALQTAVDETRDENRACIEDDEQKFLDEWKASGEMEVVEDVDREAFRSRVLQFFDENLEGQERELYDAIRASAPAS
jgi:tripartite ATP-independent transporter DctP family solute receptor